jgi:hypothetical protein
MFRSLRLMLLALLVSLVPAASYAGVFVSVGFAPPVLPVYVQPPCPEPGLMWTPGYWGYGPDGYYWVPGAWVPAPYVGALWTPGYWGWGSGLYVWHPGYWGAHVGYYGGVNYGFGYMGIGFAGGVWHGGVFAYNTAVVHVNETVIHTTYVDRTIVEHNTIVNDRHVAFSGGPGGINHAPTADENRFSHEAHVNATSFQTQHEGAAMHDTNAYASHNGGHPSNLVASRPLQAENHSAPRVVNNTTINNNRNVTVDRNTTNENTFNRNSNNGNTLSRNSNNGGNNINRNSNNGGNNVNRNFNNGGGHNESRPAEHPAPRNDNHGNENHGGHNDGHGHGR